MRFEVLLTKDAVNDLEELYEHIATHDSPRKAERVLDRIEGVLANLSKSPNRGTRPKELLEVGIVEFRQVFSKPYRIIYRVIDSNVYVFLIADGRRDMRSLLKRRLFAAD